jgi:hypothetical protein
VPELARMVLVHKFNKISAKPYSNPKNYHIIRAVGDFSTRHQ